MTLHYSALPCTVIHCIVLHTCIPILYHTILQYIHTYICPIPRHGETQRRSLVSERLRRHRPKPAGIQTLLLQPATGLRLAPRIDPGCVHLDASRAASHQGTGPQQYLTACCLSASFQGYTKEMRWGSFKDHVLSTPGRLYTFNHGGGNCCAYFGGLEGLQKIRLNGHQRFADPLSQTPSEKPG